MTASLHHADLHGLRKAKYDWLNDHDVLTTDWQPLTPDSPFHLFKPQDTRSRDEFLALRDIQACMPVNVIGFQTHRDHYAIAEERETIEARVEQLRNGALTIGEYAAKHGLRGEDRVLEARRQLRGMENWQVPVVRCLFRPFDRRWCYLSIVAMDRPRPQLIAHVAGKKNLCLLLIRQMMDAIPYSHVLATDLPAIDRSFACSRGAATAFPLYLYPGEGELFEDARWPAGQDGRRPNLSAEFVEEFAEKLGLTFVSDGRGDRKKTFGPEDVFHYAYAVFHSPTYRRRYAEFLKIDFPRLPLTSDGGLFAKLCGLGEELVGLHLLQRVPRPEATYPVNGDNEVTRTGKKAYKPPTRQAAGRVYVNDAQYFEGVPPEVWGFHVGGYQVCEKWLKDRKGRVLSYDDIETYRKITEAIRRTIRLTAEIDAAIPSWPVE